MLGGERDNIKVISIQICVFVFHNRHRDGLYLFTNNPRCATTRHQAASLFIGVITGINHRLSKHCMQMAELPWAHPSACRLHCHNSGGRFMRYCFSPMCKCIFKGLRESRVSRNLLLALQSLFHSPFASSSSTGESSGRRETSGWSPDLLRS